ncbi:MAG: acetyltransferase family protein [Collimonas fungivorans]|uniref:GNAT family N-acetyltransferase n=1 Tax=Collimonas fungivorans TaxID=158899 RepID=UPI0026F1F5E7|nr:GNAT family protein [Collimonas fungivorans]MDB5766655.1 acetyltransferase family protein [Collimonas fungivorans]
MEIFPLTTERLMLRRFTQRDLPIFSDYRNKPEVARHQSWSSFSAEDAAAFFEQQHELAFDTDDTWFQIAVERKEDAVLAGDVAVYFFDGGRQAEIGVTFDSTCQRQGYATEALSRVIDVLFNDCKKHRIVATVDARNDSVVRLLEKQGFRREGHYRENIFFKGAWSDEYSFALLEHERRAG